MSKQTEDLNIFCQLDEDLEIVIPHMIHMMVIMMSRYAPSILP